MVGKGVGLAAALAAMTLAAPVTAFASDAGAKPERTAEAKAAAKVKLYVMPQCGYCEKARELLTARGVVWEELDIASSEQAKSEFDANGGRGTPLIVIGNEVIKGLDPARIDEALATHGLVAR
ncbi:MAG TPA: glutaredoxin domain-containing protein [Tahibacter sp.]|uniref:glutaredoxin family protein n=1 Tax=Tahibacter sp. TaxID=2056211 RepID=UPI002CCA3C64|nr:glutaredoxin domain-containing protein [Tahibacter sp.]HSX59489.1 glutaredoxin domain-containing protein [Tahibacter sp.]